jgi:hypothetical protein
MSGVFSDAAKASTSPDGRPIHRPSLLFHELAENYLKTEKTMQYLDAHKGAIDRELIFRTQRPDLNKYALGAGPISRNAN